MKIKQIALSLSIQILFVFLFIPTNTIAFEREITTDQEIVEQRTANSKSYDLGDGQVLLQLHLEDIHYIAPDGTYQDIDTRPIPVPEGSDYKYYNTANSVCTYYSAELNESSVVRIEKGIHSINISPSIGEVIKADETYKAYTKDEGIGASFSAPLIPESGNAIVYSAPDSHPAFFSETIAGGTVNSIISPRPSESYTFLLKTSELTLDAENGLWCLKDASGTAIFDINACSVIDANGLHADISVEGSQTDNGYLLKLQVLNSSKLSGAVKASITITLSSINTIDTYVSSKTPTTSYGSSDVLKVGSNSANAICRSYLKFQLPDKFWRYAVTGASLRLMKQVGATPSMKAYSLTQSFSNSTTWNSMPTFSTTNASPNATVYSGNWWQMDMTNIVRAWSRGDQTHHGFLVKANAENGNLTEFVSSNGASSYKPVLNIIAKPINRTFRVKGLYGPSVSSSLVSSQLGSAKAKFLETFNVSFDIAQTAYNSSLTETSGCTLSPNYCTSVCGTVSSCSNLHHKSGGRLLTTAADSSYNTVVRYVNLKLCYYQNSNHLNINGLANTGTYSSAGRNALITITHTPPLNTTLHELTHVLGGSHCNNSTCLMYKYSSSSVTWCTSCIKSIRIMLQQTS